MPQTSSIPLVLEPYFGRRVWEQTLDEVRYQVNNERGPIFIKPLPQDHKLFNGHVVSKIVSEYRGGVHRGELIGLRHYHNDSWFYPNTKIADEALTNFEAAPSLVRWIGE